MFTDGCTEKMQKKKMAKQCKLPFSQTLPYPLLVLHYVPIKILVSKTEAGKKKLTFLQTKEISLEASKCSLTDAMKNAEEKKNG